MQQRELGWVTDLVERVNEVMGAENRIIKATDTQCMYWRPGGGGGQQWWYAGTPTGMFKVRFGARRKEIVQVN